MSTPLLTISRICGGSAESHGVAGFCGGEKRDAVIDGFHHFVFGLADADAADGVAGEIHVGELAGATFAEVGVDGALDDAEVVLGTGGFAGG